MRVQPAIHAVPGVCCVQVETRDGHPEEGEGSPGVAGAQLPQTTPTLPLVCKISTGGSSVITVVWLTLSQPSCQPRCHFIGRWRPA